MNCLSGSQVSEVQICGLSRSTAILDETDIADVLMELISRKSRK
jgi:hypothetical protein